MLDLSVSGNRDFKSSLKNINASLRDMNVELRGLKLGEDEFIGVINKVIMFGKEWFFIWIFCTRTSASNSPLIIYSKIEPF